MKNILYVLASTYGTMALGIVVSLYTKQILGPSFAGAFAIATVFMYYSNVANSVFRSALDREVPMARGRQDTEMVGKIAGHVYWATLIVNILFSAVFIIGSHFYWEDIDLRCSFLIGAFVSNITSISCYLQVHCRVHEKFKLSSFYVMSIQLILQLSILIGVVWGGMIGYVYASVFSFVATIFIAKKQLFSVTLIAFDMNVFKLILRSGILLSVYAFIQLGLFTIDRYFILEYLSRIDMGNYAVALSISSTLAALPAGLSSSILMPRWYNWASSNEWKKANASIISASFVALTVTGFVIILLALYIVPFLIQSFLNKFLLAIEPTQILCVSAYWIFMTGPFSVLLSAKQEYGKLILSALAGVVVAVVLDYSMVSGGIAGIAKATTLAIFFFSNMVFIISQHSLKVKRSEIVHNFILLNSLGIFAFLFIATDFEVAKYLFLVYIIYLVFRKNKIYWIGKLYLEDMGIAGYLLSKWK